MTTLAPIADARIDIKRYGRLLARFAPKNIESHSEHTAALAVAESLVAKGDDISREEIALLDLVSDLIERYEKKAYEPLPEATPLEILRELMEANKLKAVDLAPILGSRSKVSEILAGKRSISKEQAKRLGERFRLSPSAFF